MPKTTEQIILKSIHDKEIPIMTVWWELNYKKKWYSEEEIESEVYKRIKQILKVSQCRKQ